MLLAVFSPFLSAVFLLFYQPFSYCFISRFLTVLSAVFSLFLLAVFLFLSAVLLAILVGFSSRHSRHFSCDSYNFYSHSFNFIFFGSGFPITHKILIKQELLKVWAGSIRQFIQSVVKLHTKYTEGRYSTKLALVATVCSSFLLQNTVSFQTARYSYLLTNF